MIAVCVSGASGELPEALIPCLSPSSVKSLFLYRLAIAFEFDQQKSKHQTPSRLSWVFLACFQAKPQLGAWCCPMYRPSLKLAGKETSDFASLLHSGFLPQHHAGGLLCLLTTPALPYPPDLPVGRHRSRT